MVRGIVGGIGAVALAGAGLVGLGGAAGAASPRNEGAVPVLHSSLTPSTPNGPSMFNVAPGMVPWTIASGHALLRSNGTLQVNVARLIDPALGHNPVPYLAASLYCNGSLEGTTPTVAFSRQGNAHLRATMTLPSVCSNPAVLLNPATAASSPLPAYIAFTAAG